MKGKICRVQRLIVKWDMFFILSFRFMYGIRNVSSIAIGLSDVGTRRFIILNAIAAAVWAVVFVGIGVAFGTSMGALLGKWADLVELALAGIFLIAIIVAALVSRHRARQRRSAPLLIAGLR